MLDTLAIIGAQIFLNLPSTGLAFLVQRNADLTIGRGHRLGSQTGIFALDVEIADLAEVEDTLIPGRPMRHTAAIDIVRQMIDRLEASANREMFNPGQIDEIDIVDR